MLDATAQVRTTPVLVLDLDAVEQAVRDFRAHLPGVRVLYAVKACPHPAVLRRLVDLGVGFDVASAQELRDVLAAGADPADISYGHPVKPRAHVETAYAAGVRRFTADATAELAKLAVAAPGSQVVVRVTVDQAGADWPLADKYGVALDEAQALVHEARHRGLEPVGLVFHVGSQQRRAAAFAEAVDRCADLLRTEGLPVLNLGGGWPAQVRAGDPALADAAAAAQRAAADLPAGVRLEAEPGRSLVAAAGSVVTTVIGTADRDGTRWAYLDAGVYSGLLEADGEVTRYPLWTSAEGEPVATVLAGPTCDSTDVLYRSTALPHDLAEGDRVVLGGAGAYTTCYSTVGFNGFPPLATLVSGEDVLEEEVVGVHRPVVHPAQRAPSHAD